MIRYVNRKNTNSLKWDRLQENFSRDDLLPLWVADMDYETPSFVKEAVEEYISHPLGYYRVPEAYYDNFIRWESKRHAYEIRKEWIRFAPGVVPGIYWVIGEFTRPGDHVLIQTPVYHPFSSAVEDQKGRVLVRSPLHFDGKRYGFDRDELERDIRDNDVKAMVLCNPHNPVGRVWTREELAEVADICRRYDVILISDEIHQDFENPDLGVKMTPCALASDYQKIVTLTSGGKTFNLGGLQNAYVVIEDEEIRRRYDAYAASVGCHGGNSVGYVATEAAYGGGEKWVDELLRMIYDHYSYVSERLSRELPKVRFPVLEGTYLMWLDFSEYFDAEGQMKEFFEGKCGLAFNYGSVFGGKEYGRFVRLNLATSMANLDLALDRIVEQIRG